MDTIVVFSPAPGPSVGPVSASWRQQSYRFYNNDGSPAAATAAAALNTPISLALNTQRHVRFLIQETAGSNQSEQIFIEMAYRIDTGGGFGAWTQIGSVAVNDDPIRQAASTHITDQAHISQRIGSGTFRDGVATDDARRTTSPNGTVSATQGLDEYEFHMSFILDSSSSNPASSGDQIELRLEYTYDEIWRGDPLESYVNFPVINVT